MKTQHAGIWILVLLFVIYLELALIGRVYRDGYLAGINKGGYQTRYTAGAADMAQARFEARGNMGIGTH
jgi:hypothetical protein